MKNYLQYIKEEINEIDPYGEEDWDDDWTSLSPSTILPIGTKVKSLDGAHVGIVVEHRPNPFNKDIVLGYIVRWDGGIDEDYAYWNDILYKPKGKVIKMRENKNIDPYNEEIWGDVFNIEGKLYKISDEPISIDDYFVWEDALNVGPQKAISMNQQIGKDEIPIDLIGNTGKKLKPITESVNENAKEYWNNIFNNFSVGDEVICSFKKNVVENYENEKGVIRYIDKEFVGIEFENFINGHDGVGWIGKLGNCWNFSERWLYDLKIEKEVKQNIRWYYKRKLEENYSYDSIHDESVNENINNKKHIEYWADIFNNYFVGDEVICSFYKGKKYENEKGIIRCINDDEGYIGIEFENDIDGHSGDGYGEYGHCWNFGRAWPYELKIEKENIKPNVKWYYKGKLEENYSYDLGYDNWEQFMSEMKIGDKVICSFSKIHKDYINEKGVIKYKRADNNNFIGIEFENDIGGHYGKNWSVRGKDGHCWNFSIWNSYKLKIEKIDDTPPNDGKIKWYYKGKLENHSVNERLGVSDVVYETAKDIYYTYNLNKYEGANRVHPKIRIPIDTSHLRDPFNKMEITLVFKETNRPKHVHGAMERFEDNKFELYIFQHCNNIPRTLAHELKHIYQIYLKKKDYKRIEGTPSALKKSEESPTLMSIYTQLNQRGVTSHKDFIQKLQALPKYKKYTKILQDDKQSKRNKDIALKMVKKMHKMYGLFTESADNQKITLSDYYDFLEDKNRKAFADVDPYGEEEWEIVDDIDKSFRLSKIKVSDNVKKFIYYFIKSLRRLQDEPQYVTIPFIIKENKGILLEFDYIMEYLDNRYSVKNGWITRNNERTKHSLADEIRGRFNFTNFGEPSRKTDYIISSYDVLRFWYIERNKINENADPLSVESDIKINVEGKNGIIDRLIDNLTLVVKKRKLNPVRIKSITGYINKETFIGRGYVYETKLEVVLSNKDIIFGKYESKDNNIIVKVNGDIIYDINHHSFDNEILVDKMVGEYKKYLKNKNFVINENANSEKKFDIGPVIRALSQRYTNKETSEIIYLYFKNKTITFYYLENDYQGRVVGGNGLTTEINQAYYDGDDLTFIVKNGNEYIVDLDIPITIHNKQIEEPKTKIRWYHKGKLE